MRLKEIYRNIVGQMMSFLESFENVNQERGHEIVDPTNVPVTRVFGLLKYSEKALPNLQFGLLAQHTMAKFNKVSEDLQKIKQDHFDPQANILAVEQRIRDEVLDSFSLCFDI